MTCVTHLATRLADAGVDVVKIKELMGHASIVTTMRYIHATDQEKRGTINVLSEYRQRRRQDGHKLVTNHSSSTVLKRLTGILIGSLRAFLRLWIVFG